MKHEHKNGRSTTPEGFDARMIARRDREARDEAEKQQAKVPVHVLNINGVKVSFGELPQLAQQIGAKRACKLVAYFSEAGQETAENWRKIYLQLANCSAYPDCLYFVFHIPMDASHNPNMENRMHKGEPCILNLMCTVVVAITDGDSQLIPVVQGSKHWALQNQGRVEMTMVWI